MRSVARQQRSSAPDSSAVDSSSVAVNHLFVGRDMMTSCSNGAGNRCARWPHPLSAVSYYFLFIYYATCASQYYKIQ